MKDELEPFDPEIAALVEVGRAQVSPDEGAKARVGRRLSRVAEGRAPTGRGVRLALGAAAMAASVALGAGLHALVARKTPATTSNRASFGSPVPPPPVRQLGALGGDSSGRALLDEAALRLTQKDAAGALEKLEAHEKSHPSGPLTELREAMTIEALARAGQGAAARLRAAKFFVMYPASLLAPAVADALARIGDE